MARHPHNIRQVPLPSPTDRSRTGTPALHPRTPEAIASDMNITNLLNPFAPSNAPSYRATDSASPLPTPALTPTISTIDTSRSTTPAMSPGTIRPKHAKNKPGPNSSAFDGKVKYRPFDLKHKDPSFTVAEHSELLRQLEHFQVTPCKDTVDGALTNMACYPHTAKLCVDRTGKEVFDGTRA